ncbi:MAG: O-antigen ligase family protein [Acidobacteriota bacterium]
MSVPGGSGLRRVEPAPIPFPRQVASTSTLRRVVLAGVGAVAILAPLPFGSVTPRAASFLTLTCLLVGSLWIVWRAAEGRFPLPVAEPLLLCGALVLGYGMLQIVPLPPAVLESLSPAAAEIRRLYEPVSPSGWRPVSVYPYATAQSVLRGLGLLLIGLAALDLARRRSDRLILGGVLLASGGFQAFYGLAEYFSGRQHIFGFAKNLNTGVATGTFINPNHHAGYLELLLPLGIAGLLLALERRRAAETTAGRDRAAFLAAVAGVIVLGMATSVVASGSRMGLVAALGSLIAVGTVAAIRSGARGFGIAVLVAALGFLGLVAHGRGRHVIARFVASADQFQSTMGRFNMWEQSAAMADRFRLTGTGIGTFPEIMPAFQRGGDGRILRHAHNDYLEWLAELGLPGMVLLGLVLVVVLRSASRGHDPEDPLTLAALAGLLALALHSIVDFNLAIPSNALTAVLLLGLLLGAARGENAVVPRSAPAPRMAAVPILSVILLAAIPGAAPWMPLPEVAEAPTAELRSSWALAAADSGGERRLLARARAMHAAALADFQTLIRNGSPDRPPSREALLYLQTRLDRAERLQEAGLLRRPTDPRAHLDLGLMQASSCSADTLLTGQIRPCASMALEQIRRALALQPSGAPLHGTAARFLIAVWTQLRPEERREATAYVERALRFRRDDRSLREAWEALHGGG